LIHAPAKEVIDQLLASLIYEETDQGFDEILSFIQASPKSKKKEILQALGGIRQNRRHKSPRALEHADFTFEIVADFGCFRDLHRHRILTQQKQKLDCDLGYFVPDEIAGTEMEPIYREALEEAKSFFDKLKQICPLESQYAVPMAYNIRWYVKINLRALQWMVELRSTPQGHPEYRKVAQQMAKLVMENFEELTPLLSFVDFSEHAIGRLAQEERSLKKKGVQHAN
jgi:thymidylate synthase ThyX